jgi:hypothetical protein
MSKTYIGSGKKHATYDVVNVNICLDDATPFIFTSEKSGKRYLSFDVSLKQSVDQYGNTHSCSIYRKDDTGQPDKPVPDLKPASQSESFSEENIPF